MVFRIDRGGRPLFSCVHAPRRLSAAPLAGACPLPMTGAQLETARRLLCALQDHLLAALGAARARGGREFARVAGVTAADTIYQVEIGRAHV